MNEYDFVVLFRKIRTYVCAEHRQRLSSDAPATVAFREVAVPMSQFQSGNANRVPRRREPAQRTDAGFPPQENISFFAATRARSIGRNLTSGALAPVSNSAVWRILMSAAKGIRE